jgi:glycosyltransferase involved in cell wall biosynthesis
MEEPYMLEVGFDDQAFFQRRGGISRYFVELIRALSTDPSLGISPILGARWSNNGHLVEAGLSAPLPGTLGEWTQASKLEFLANSRARGRARRASVIHQTYYHPWWIRTRRGTKVVITVHDMIPELEPDLFASNPHLKKEQYVRRADLILCVSESTKRDLFAVYGDLDADVRVTLLGVDERFQPDGPIHADLPSPFILFVGKRDAYKDFFVLAEAYAGSTSRFRALVAVGGGAPNDDEREGIRKLGLADRFVWVGPDDELLRRIYRSASLFVFPSRYEGFGLPTLEAMASGTPTVLARSSSLPEVGGDAALYFPPGDVDELRRIIEVLSDEPQTLATLGVSGLAQAKRFSWARTARSTAAGYLAD